MSVLAPKVPDKIDSFFAGLVDASKSGWFQEDRDEYFRGFHVGPEDVVLDVGCGDGNATLFSARRGARVIYSDIVAENVEEVARKLGAMDVPGECIGQVSDSDPLPQDDSTATRIMCMEVLEHVEDPQRVMAQLVRVGKPGAVYLLTVPGERGELIQKEFAPKEYFQHPNHIRIFSEVSFRELVESAGLEIVSYDATGFFWVTWMSMYWAVQAAKGEPGEHQDGATHKRIEPPFDDSLNRWASLWVKLISTPEGLAFKHEMDRLLPKNQVIIARKPG